MNPPVQLWIAKSIMVLLLVRSVVGFLPVSTLSSVACKSRTSTIVRSSKRYHYNSLWNRQRRRRPISPLQHATQSDDDNDSDNLNNTNTETTTSPQSTTATTTTSHSDDIWSAYRNRNNIQDQVVSAISKQGGIKVTACTIRNIVNDLMMQHSMTDVAIQAMGRTLTCSLLMANGIQREQTVQITLNSDGPLRGLVAIASGGGNVRGFVGSPMLGEMSLEEAVGKGAVQVVKNHPDWPRPYNGITAIRHGDIDRDIGLYLAESEQRSCALAAATAVTGILCQAAGGYLIEQLPDVTEEEIVQVENNLAKIVELDGGDQLPTNLLLGGTTPLELMVIILDGLDMQPLQVITPTLQCDCSEDRLFRALRLLPEKEVQDLLDKEEKLEARCQFCGKVYTMGPDDVRKKLDDFKGDVSLDSEFEEKK